MTNEILTKMCQLFILKMQFINWLIKRSMGECENAININDIKNELASCEDDAGLRSYEVFCGVGGIDYENWNM